MKEKEYRVTSIKFVRAHEVYEDDFIFIYEISFNKSIGHTGRIKGIENGLNKYVESEFKINSISLLNKILSSVVSIFKKK
jgi:hypothetical protein